MLYQDPITAAARDFVRLLGDAFDGSLADQYLIHWILRPVKEALRKIFKPHFETWPAAELRALQIAIANWPGCRDLPLYGPRKGWADLAAQNPHMSRAQESAIILLAHGALPAVFFTSLQSCLKRYASLKEALQTGSENSPVVVAAREDYRILTEAGAASAHSAQSGHGAIKIEREAFAGGTLMRGMGRAFLLRPLSRRLYEMHRDGSISFAETCSSVCQAELTARAAIADNRIFAGDVRESLPVRLDKDEDSTDILRFIHCRHRSFSITEFSGQWFLSGSTVHFGPFRSGFLRRLYDQWRMRAQDPASVRQP